MEEYPLILRPHLIQSVQNQSPLKLLVLPQKINYLSLFFLEIISAVISSTIAIATQNQNLGFILFIVFTLGVIGWGWWQQNSYPDRLRESRKRHQAKWRQQRFREAMKQLNPSYDGNGSNAKKGHSEENFASYLFNYFPQNIHQEIVIQNPNYNKGFHYTADFAYIDKELKIYIDIEIDEPYAYKSRKPLHYIDSDTDLRRNEYFLERDWFVIRFSEEQIVKSPKNCCKTIADLIAEIKGKESIPKQLINVQPVNKISRWSEDEARRMADENYRQTYL